MTDHWFKRKRMNNTRNRDERLRISANICDDFSASETEAFKEDDICIAPQDNREHFQYEENLEAKHEVDTEVVSCYCSASHTDNISTDEHDSLRESHINSNRTVLLRGLQSSDSGADLTEYVKSDYDSAWHKYWTTHGERLIWDSWITKYSAYINPDYLNSSTEPLESADIPKTSLENNCDVGPSKTQEHSKNNKFSFDKRDLEKFSTELLKQEGEHNSNLGRIDENAELKNCTERRRSQEIAHNNSMLIRALSGSDSFEKLHTDISEGWNPLSPASVDYEVEAERLLSSRCGSYASSSVRTVDSMTNVTRMTISSFDFSDSSKTSDSFSSVSSVQSSLSSTSSEEIEDSTDYEQQWNILWKRHYEEEYLEQYKKFLCSHSDQCVENSKEILGVDHINPGNQVTGKYEIQETGSSPTVKNIRKILKLNSKERRGNNSFVDGNSSKIKSKHCLSVVGYLLNSLRMNDSSNTVSMDESEIDAQDNNTRTENETGTNIPIEIDVEDFKNCENPSDVKFQMKALGLPVSFGRKLAESSPEKKLTSLKRSYESDPDSDEQSTFDHIKSAFLLMGIEFHETDKPKLKGQVEYKMKHIRLQNRHLKLHRNLKQQLVKPKHIYFNEQGDEIPEDKDSEEIMLQNLSDNSDIKQSTSSNDEDVELNKASISPPDIRDDLERTVDVSRKKRRKRKLNLPIEIKENPKLKKYWNRRFSLFNKFDLGVRLDEESWYSVTPEAVAKHTAERLKCSLVIDAFCGAGGNSIQFASTCERVIAIDIDPRKIDLARNNAEVYGVADKIEFIVGDFFHLSDKLQADVVFLSPPWGGPSYLSLPTYELEHMLQPVSLSSLLEAARKISENVALFLPRNSNTYPLLIASGPGGKVEIEQNFINKKLIAITAYYNDLIKNI